MVDTASDTVTDRVRGVQGPVDLVIPAPPAPVDPPAEPKADLAVTLDAAAVPALLGGRIDYTLTVTDTSTTTASTGATVTVALTPGTLTPATTAPGCTAAPGRLTCTLTGLAPGASARRTFSLPVALLSLGTAYRATATRTAATPADPGPGNDSASRSCTALTALIITCG
ncbi:hypothetical protein ACFQ2M_38000 [Kitasatospora saccharophila]|uniref:hypothetical protein n=1 Tax=Kitasatospora saccharophila TaxID=407973 RepID=UPI0036455808